MKVSSNRLRSLGLLKILVCCLALLLVAAPSWSQSVKDLQQPAEGQWAPTTLALLHYNRDLCHSIAGKVRQYWRALGDSNAKAEQIVRDYVLESSLSDLAAARAAGDIIDRFLRPARQETNKETGASLARLANLGSTLCDSVALPTSPRETYDQQIRDLMTQIEREEAELGRLLVVPDEILQRALQPYLVPIQMAGVEAEGQYLDYLESIRPKPKLPTQQELMVAWHQVYAVKTAAVKQSLAEFLKAKEQNDAIALRKACRDISSEVISVLRDETLFDTPDPQLNQPLLKTYQEIRDLASHCSAARFREVNVHIEVVQRYLAYVAQALAPYSLLP